MGADHVGQPQLAQPLLAVGAERLQLGQDRLVVGHQRQQRAHVGALRHCRPGGGRHFLVVGAAAGGAVELGQGDAEGRAELGQRARLGHGDKVALDAADVGGVDAVPVGRQPLGGVAQLALRPAAGEASLLDQLPDALHGWAHPTPRVRLPQPYQT